MDKVLETRKEIVNMQQQHYQDSRDNVLQVKRMIVSHCYRQAKVEKTEQIRSWRYTNIYELMYELQVENVPHTIKNVFNRVNLHPALDGKVKMECIQNYTNHVPPQKNNLPIHGNDHSHVAKKSLRKNGELLRAYE